MRKFALALLAVLGASVSLVAAASATPAVSGGPPVASNAVTSTTWSTATAIAPPSPSVRVVPLTTCAPCAGGGTVVPACYTYDAYGSSYLNSGLEGINMHLWFSACHDGYGTITQIWGAGQTCNAWGFINERNAYVNQDSGGLGQGYVRFHSHCEFSPSVGGLSTFWMGHDLYATALGRRVLVACVGRHRDRRQPRVAHTLHPDTGAISDRQTVSPG
jgi:hypothetical protein